MSCYYDLRCLDCDVDTGYSYGNREQQQLLEVTRLRPELEALGLAAKKLKMTGSFPENREPVSSWAYFYAEHVGHTVVVKSEYWNDAYFGCDECVDEEYKRDAGLRENTRLCRLDANHEGPHSRTRPDGK